MTFPIMIKSLQVITLTRFSNNSRSFINICPMIIFIYTGYKSTSRQQTLHNTFTLRASNGDQWHVYNG
nr:MAG TPA: hypothetical protein [Caudoviricetes sp.]